MSAPAPESIDRVGLVLVSHSAALADGVAELARQMAPDVALWPVGGSDDGGLGTSFERISAALTELGPAGGIVLYDLGSARLTTETALEFLDETTANRIELVDAPLVEGALAAAVAAQGGGDRAEVVAAARGVGNLGAGNPAASPVESVADAAIEARTVLVRNPLGLHARPAAELVRALAGLDADVTIGRRDQHPVDARSLLAVVGLATRAGDELRLSASGPDADGALTTLTELIETGFGESDAPAVPEDSPAAGSAGRAVGRLQRITVTAVPDVRADDPELERERLDAALAAAVSRLDRGDPMARAHAALLSDPSLAASAQAELDQGWSAASGWWRAVSRAANELAASGDPVVAGRAVDVREAGAAVLTELGIELDRVPSDATGLILLADELGPGEVTEFEQRGGAGIVLEHGTPTAHAVVVARGLGLPLVLGGQSMGAVADGTVVAIDGTAGTIEVDPADQAPVRRQIVGDFAPVEVGGRRIMIAANIGSVAEARAAVAYGADAVGLLRTELLLLDRPELPDEESQRAELAEIFAVLGDRPVVVRVLDAGGDKPVRALQLDPQHNGFLGVRGLRWLLAHPEVLHTQLRAISRAAVGHHVSVMAPMVSLAREAQAFVAAIEDAQRSLDEDGLDHIRPEQVGVMVEVPAAALAADELGRLVDFLSIGSNDLLSYTFAADRTEPGVANLLEPDSTAMERLLGQICERAGVPVHVCGELAADPQRARWFVDRGVTELSMAAPRIPEVKRALRDVRISRPDQ